MGICDRLFGKKAQPTNVQALGESPTAVKASFSDHFLRIMKINFRVVNLSNLYVIAVLRGGYAWLQDVHEKVHRVEQEFCEQYCKVKGWDRNTLTVEQAREICQQEGFRRAGEMRRRKNKIGRRGRYKVIRVTAVTEGEQK